MSTNGKGAVAERVEEKPVAKKVRGQIVKPVKITEFKVSEVEVEISETSPLLVHQFGAKARKQILDKQMGEAQGPRDKKNPFMEFLSSLYILDAAKVPKKEIGVNEEWPYVEGAFGFPASGFKKAIVAACTFIQNVPKTVMRSVHVFPVDAKFGNMIPLKYDRLVMQEDVVNIGGWKSKTADIRHRGCFYGWSVTVKIRFVEGSITHQQIVQAINAAGYFVGIGEWRPEKSGGTYGMFQLTK